MDAYLYVTYITYEYVTYCNCLYTWDMVTEWVAPMAWWDMMMEWVQYTNSMAFSLAVNDYI